MTSGAVTNNRNTTRMTWTKTKRRTKHKENKNHSCQPLGEEGRTKDGSMDEEREGEGEGRTMNGGTNL